MKSSTVFLIITAIITMMTMLKSQFLPVSYKIDDGFALVGHVIQTVPNILPECLVTCQDSLDCYSINVYKDRNGNDMCQLNNCTKEHCPQSHVGMLGYRYVQSSDASYWTKCSKKPCQHGGQCILDDGPYHYICNCTGKYAGRNCQKECVIFDFENGIDEWTLTGTAFSNQPTYGDNPTARNRRDQPSNHRGDWWIGTYENRSSPSHLPGEIVGDLPTGIMTSPKFVIRGRTLKLLVGGSKDITKERVELLVDGNVIAQATGSRHETMNQKTFNVENYRGRIAQIRIVDGCSKAWCHINVDHIEDSICHE